MKNKHITEILAPIMTSVLILETMIIEQPKIPVL